MKLTAKYSLYSKALSLFFNLFSCLMLCLSLGIPLHAQTASPDDTLDGLRKQIEVLQKGLTNPDSDDDLLAWRGNALAAQKQAQLMANALEPQLASVQERLTELGKPSTAVKEAADIAKLRFQLDKSSSVLDARLKLAQIGRAHV